MSGANEKDKTLALAGTFQSAALARQLARRGYADEQPLMASVRSILIQDAISTASVYGGVEGVRLGLMSMSQFSATPGDVEATRYVVNLIQLAGNLRSNPPMLEKIDSVIQEVQAELSLEDDGAFSSEFFEKFADLYKNTISTLKPRIIIQGEQGHLGNDHIVTQVRTCLLAGVRSGFLWLQLGGRRWHLLFQRKNYIDGARLLIQDLEAEAGTPTFH